MTRAVSMLAALLLFGATASAQDDAKALRKEAKAKVKQFKKSYRRAKSSEDLIGLIRDLAEMKHPEIMKELNNQLRVQRDKDILAVVIDEIGMYAKDAGAAGILTGALESFAGRAVRMDNLDQRHEPAVACLQALVRVGLRSPTRKVVKLIHHANLTLARAAVDALGKLHDVTRVDDLIALLRELERYSQPGAQSPPLLPGMPPQGPYPNRPPPNPNDPNDPQWDNPLVQPHGYVNPVAAEQRKRKNILEPAIKAALKELTGRSEVNATRWGSWWSKNRSKLIRRQKEQEKQSTGK